MEHLISVIAAATALSMPQTGMTAGAPVAVSACSIMDTGNGIVDAEVGPPISYRSLFISFRNTQDENVTRVTFDVVNDGVRATVKDQGGFSKGALIEHRFDDFAGTYGRSNSATCTVHSVTFADGSTWTPAGGRESMAATIH
jgi:hypothetical protein